MSAEGATTGGPSRFDESPRMSPFAARVRARPSTTSPGLNRGSAPDPRAPILVTANQQVTVTDTGAAAPIRAVNSARALAWADGRLIFDHESVADAVRQFNRYNRIQLTVNDAALAQRTISGVFSAADPTSFVAFIETVMPVQVTRDDRGDIAMIAPN